MSKEPHNEKLDELLRQYLLDQDADSLPEDSVLNKSSEFVFNSPPLVTPSPEKEAEMMAKLKDAFPETEPASNVASIRRLGGRWTWIAVAASIALIALATVAIDPFASDEPNPANSNPQVATESITPDQQLADNVESNTNDGQTTEPIGTLNPGPSGTDQVNSTASTGNPGKDDPVSVRKPNDRFPFQGQNKPDPVAPPTPTPVAQLFAQTSTPAQEFNVSASEENFVSASSGTKVFIPAEAFVDASGNTVTGKIDVEFKEVYKKSDFVLTNLSTTSDGKLLESGGMVYVNASSNGKPLQLAPGKKLQIEFAADRELNAGWKLFTGEFDQNGSMNWTPVSTPRQGMTPLPIEKINFKQFLSASRGHAQWDRYIEQLNSPRYEDTYIATQEFVERLWIARNMGYLDWILGMYMDGTGYALNKVDREVLNSFNGNTKSTAQKLKILQGFEALQALSKSGTNYVEHYDDRGVNLDAPGARSTLVALGLDDTGIDKLFRLNENRKLILAEINGPVERKENGNSLQGESNMFVHTRSGKGQQWVWKENIWNLNLEQPNMSFAVAHTGWLNLDRFAPTATKTHSVTVEVSTTAPSSSVKTFFVFSDKNSVIEGTLDANGKMKFDIPAGAKGEIVTAVYNTGIPAISREAIVVNADLEKTVTPQSGTLEAFREEVAGLDRG